MRKLNKQTQKMYYALQNDESVPNYERDSHGEVVYKDVGGKQMPVKTGTFSRGYDLPVEFFNGISGDLTEADLQAFGIDDSDGHAKMTYPSGTYHFVVGTLIWKKSQIRYIGDRVDEKSADYTVVAVRDEDLNIWSCLLKKVLK